MHSFIIIGNKTTERERKICNVGLSGEGRKWNAKMTSRSVYILMAWMIKR